MTYLTPVYVGQTWRSRDPRDNGRTVEVVAVDKGVNDLGNNGFVTVRSVRRSRMRAITLHSRYELMEADRV